MPETQPLLVSTLPPTPAQERAALAVATSLAVFFAMSLWFAGTQLPRIEATIPVVSAFMFVGDCVSAVLLFGQFAVVRTRALLVLASGYLFTGLLVVPYALTFPGAFSPAGLLGAGLQTAGWIFAVWHVGLPLAAIGYVLLRDARDELRTPQWPVAASVALGGIVSIGLAALAAAVAIAFNDSLPRLSEDAMKLSRDKTVPIVMVIVSSAALALAARNRRSVLDTWLAVVLFAWVLDSVLTYATDARYSVVWYANRVVRVVAANIVLFVLLAETMRLYAKLAAAVVAQRRERQSRMMTMEAMSAAIEHELRQPLAAIAANAGAAQRWMAHSPPNVSESREAVEQIVADTGRAAEILGSVRRLFASRGADSPDPVDANALIEEAIELARMRLDSSAIGVQLRLDPRLPRVAVNGPQLQEVIVNLVNNAADAMENVAGHAAVITIETAAKPGGLVEITVADTGAGIEPRDAERIFEAFFTTKPGGMGMGLAICRTIVERHGGTLSVSRGSPYGSVFLVELPSA